MIIVRADKTSGHFCVQRCEGELDETSRRHRLGEARRQRAGHIQLSYSHFRGNFHRGHRAEKYCVWPRLLSSLERSPKAGRD